MIIGINGKIGTGKDTVGKIIQYLTDEYAVKDKLTYNEWLKEYYEIEEGNNKTASSWAVKKFADKLKDIVCLLLDCTREQLEDREFKEKELGEEWNYVLQDGIPLTVDQAKRDKEFPFNERYIQRLTPRLLLQLLGTDCGRDIIHPNIWVNTLFVDYKELVSVTHVIIDFSKEDSVTKVSEPIPIEYPKWIITDVRFPNELKAIKDRDGITIRVNRTYSKIPIYIPGEECNGVSRQDFEDARPKHPSETALDNAKFDYTIDNNGTIEELIEKVKEILIKLKII